MPNNWKTYKLSKVTTKIGSGATPRGGKEAYKSSGISLIRSQNVLDFTFSTNGLAFIDEEQASKLNNVTIEENDILLNITGDSVARVCKVPSEFLPARVNQHVAIVRADSEITDSNYLLYSLLEKTNKSKLLTLASAGATRNAITKSMIENFEVTLPPLQEQQSISSILSAIDDKIENNLAINKTLEEMAMALYKHWFVDFGPFQDGEFVESELGRIPKGWEVKRLSDCNDLVLGGTPSRKNENYWENGTIGWLNSGKVNEFRIIEPSEYITQEALRKSSTKIMQKGTTVIAITGATLGQISRIEKEFCANQSVIGILKSDLFSNEYIYLWIHFAIEELLKLATGGAQQHVNKNNVGDLKILYPNPKIINEFQNAVTEMFENISNNMFENQTLIQLRDTLLPKLISGEVRLKEFVSSDK